MILYLHGFRSSPESNKTTLLRQRLRQLGRSGDYHCPQLPPSPRAAISLASRIAAQVPASQLTLVGSSLGGYYATHLAERLGCRAVLLNPAVNAARDLAGHVGQSTTYHGNQPFEFKKAYLAELEALRVLRPTRMERYFLIAATGDELLDWRDMVAHYQGARQKVIAGSDHGLSDFADYQDEVLAFCGIETGRPTAGERRQ